MGSVSTTAQAHTPAPWTIATRPERPLVFAGGELVASCRTTFQTKNRELANARIIAAAPELLEACKLLMEVMDKESHLKALIQQGDLGMINNAMVTGRDAIAKAS